MRRKIASWLLMLAAIYAVACAYMFLQQRSLMYFPPAAILNDPDWPSIQAIKTHTADGLNLAAWFAAPAKPDGKIVVLFHGNAGDLTQMATRAKLFQDAGYGVFLCEYRGYAGNPGSPTEQGLYEDGRAAFAWLKERGYKPEQFVIYGRSIGSGVAVQMALEMQPRELILEAAFSSAADVAKGRFGFLPVDLIMYDRYDSVDKIGKIKTRLLAMHGDADTVVPIRFGRKLFAAAAEPKEFLFVPGGSHNNLYSFNIAPKVLAWLNKAVEDEKSGEVK